MGLWYGASNLAWCTIDCLHPPSAQEHMMLALWTPHHCVIGFLGPFPYVRNALPMAIIHSFPQHFPNNWEEDAPLYL